MKAVERGTNVEYKIIVKGNEEVFFGKKGEAGSASALKRRLEGLKYASFDIIDDWEDGQMCYKIDGCFYTVETLSGLTEDSVKESVFRQELTEIITSLGLEVVSIEGEFSSQSEEVLREIEEEKDAIWRRDMGICRRCEERKS